jgi:tetratricopeptide (TPR) repeat protein
MENKQPSSDMIEVYDGYGRKLQVKREVWRTQILPDSLRKNWNDPNQLYSIIFQSLRDGFFAEILDASRQLHRIDTDPLRGAITLGVVLLQLKNADEAEKVLLSAKTKHGEDGTLLTNLAKVYSAQGKDALSREILWHALEIDPNLDNGLLWYVAIARERGGASEERKAFEQITALPKSWRAHLWLARYALAEKDIVSAKSHYKKVFSAIQPLPADALMQISGDLGRAGYLKEIIEIVLPYFEISQHGIYAANNILKAYLDIGNPLEAKLLLEKLYAQDRPDWRETLKFWESEIAKVTVPSKTFEKDKIPSVTLLYIEKPIWAREDSGFQRLISEKSEDAIKVSFVCGSVEFRPLPNEDNVIRAQKASAAGQFSRGIPLFLAEQVHLQTKAVGICIVPWLEQAGFALFEKPWQLEKIPRDERNDCDYIVFLHISAVSEPWNAELKLFDYNEKKLMGSWELSLDPEKAALTIKKELADLFNKLRKAADLASQTNDLFLPPDEKQLASYISSLEQALAVVCATDLHNTDSFLYSERSIIDALFHLVASQPANVPARLLLMSTLLKESKRRPNIVQEYCKKIELLQKQIPLQGKIGEAVKKISADLVKIR